MTKAAITGNFLDMIGDRGLESKHFAAICRWYTRDGFDKKKGNCGALIVEWVASE